MDDIKQYVQQNKERFINELIDFTLENRSKFKHQVLIGRNLLRDLAIVDVSEKYMTKVDGIMPPVDTPKQ